MTSNKYIGIDVHKEAISTAVMNSAGKLLMESIIKTKAITIPQCFAGMRGSLHVTFVSSSFRVDRSKIFAPRPRLSSAILRVRKDCEVRSRCAACEKLPSSASTATYTWVSRNARSNIRTAVARWSYRQIATA